MLPAAPTWEPRGAARMARRGPCCHLGALGGPHGAWCSPSSSLVAVPGASKAGSGLFVAFAGGSLALQGRFAWNFLQKLLPELWSKMFWAGEMKLLPAGSKRGGVLPAWPKMIGVGSVPAAALYFRS